MYVFVYPPGLYGWPLCAVHAKMYYIWHSTFHYTFVSATQ